MDLSAWGPVVDDPHLLCSPRVIELVAVRAGAEIGDVAEELLRMQPRRRYLSLGTIAQTRRCTVLAAVDQLLAREVALKLPRDADEDRRWAMLAEVQVLAGFDHDNIVRVHEFGVLEGRPYAVMELCDANLDEWSRERTWTVVLDRLLEAGRGLAQVHAAGFVHGDVKPENILVKGDVAKLGDFGLVSTPGWTARIQGTPGYIAPEVADGKRDAAGDVFAFACAAWACLARRPAFGEPPVGADSSAATLILVERAWEGVFDERGRETSEVPAAVFDVLRRALQPSPDDRPTLSTLLAQLAELRADRRTRRWRWPRRLLGGRCQTRDETRPS